MNDLVKQITSYNLFNYLLPGAVFCVISEMATSVELVQDEIFTAFFFYYFVGLIVSRIGSLVVEPAAKKLKIVQLAEYSAFVAAEAKDQKISLISEMNNVYRTAVALGLCIVIYPLAIWIANQLNLDTHTRYIIFGVAVSLLFLLSYRKQTSYVTRRVRISTSSQSVS